MGGGVIPTWWTVVEGLSVRKLENHCRSWYYNRTLKVISKPHTPSIDKRKAKSAANNLKYLGEHADKTYGQIFYLQLKKKTHKAVSQNGLFLTKQRLPNTRGGSTFPCVTWSTSQSVVITSDTLPIDFGHRLIILLKMSSYACGTQA